MIKRNRIKAVFYFGICLLIFLGIFYLLYFRETSLVINAGLSKNSVNKITNGVEKSQLIEGVIIVSVDLQRNMRHSVYTMIKDPNIQSIYDKFANGAISIEVPFFTGDETHDKRLIRVINNEFVCSPFKETIAYKYAPQAAEKITTVCAISIPPSYGEFKGIVGLYLRKVPSDIEKDQLRIYIKDMSEDVANDLK